MSAKLAEAHARGREEGLTQGRAEASDRHAAELAAAREQAETQRQEFHINEYMEFEGAIRSGLRQIEDNVGAAVTRILAPFLAAGGRQAGGGRIGPRPSPGSAPAVRPD